MKEELLVLAPLDEEYLDRIGREFTVKYAPWADLETIRGLGPKVRAVWTNGTVGLRAEAIDALPELKVVHAHGAGYDQIDAEALRRRGATLTNGAGTNDACVADHAMALLLAVVRDIPRMDRESRKGGWAELRVNRPSIYGRRLGIVGLGKIGKHIARRASAFDIEVGYFGRNPQPEVPYRYYDNLVRLAADSDFLVLSCMGGKGTFHIVNAEVLKALGPEGFLVNVARGSVVDSAALIEALKEGRIAGAAVDVYEKEPGIPDEFRDLPNLVLTPHLAGLSSQVRDEQIALGVRNFLGYFAGRQLENVVVG